MTGSILRQLRTRNAASERESVSGFEQLMLAGVEDVIPTTAPTTSNTKRESCQRLDRDPLGPLFLRRYAALGPASAGVKAYCYQLHSILRIAQRHTAKPCHLVAIFDDPDLLGRVLIDDVAPATATRLSKWTLAQRRSAVRCFASVMRPELREAIGVDPHDRIDEALRTVAERVGSGYRLTGGRPRHRGGYVPTRDDVSRVIEAATQIDGYRGRRNSVFFRILAQTGTRVNALRQLNGSDCVEMPSGRMRLFVHDKGKREPREIELSRELSEELHRYIDLFNQFATGRRWKTRIRIGNASPIWRNSAHGRWPYPAIGQALQQACGDAGVPRFSPHSLRRAFATDATAVLPRYVVALAGGWQGLDRLDDHYVRPRQRDIWSKLAWGSTQDQFGEIEEQTAHEAARTLR